MWIHGGSWLTGSGGPVVYNPDFFMDKVFFNNPSYFLFQGVVHVGVNYRLGALGFLALEGEAGGNQGLRDQVSEASEIKSNLTAEHGLVLGAREHQSLWW